MVKKPKKTKKGQKWPKIGFTKGLYDSLESADHKPVRFKVALLLCSAKNDLISVILDPILTQSWLKIGYNGSKLI